MIKNSFYIQPRESGKTHNLHKYFLNNKDSYLVALTIKDHQRLKLMFHGESDRILYIGNLNGYNYKYTLLIDEYLFFNRKETYYHDIICFKNIILTSSVNITYSHILFTYVKKSKVNNRSLWETIKDFHNFIGLSENDYVYYEKLIIELWYSFLCEPNIKLIDQKLPEFKYPSKKYMKYSKNVLGVEEYETAILNKYTDHNG